MLLETIQPVKEVGKLAEEYGFLYMVNASQSVGQIKVDVKEIKWDFLVAPCRKWLRGPQGLGFLYCRKELINEIEPSHIGWNTTKWINNEYEHKETAERFEAGEQNFPAIVGFKRALKYLDEIGGINAVRKRIKYLTAYTIEKLSELKSLKIYGTLNEKLRGGIIPFNVEKTKPELVLNKLIDQKIIVEAGDFATPLALKLFNAKSWVRVCVHYMNNEEDIDKLVQILKEMWFLTFLYLTVIFNLEFYL